VTYGFSLTALAGIALKWLTGAQLIFEVPSEPGKAYLADTSRPRLVNHLFAGLAAIALHFAAFFADRASLLYPNQLARYPLLRRYPTSVIHAFVPISTVRRRELREKYILLVGHPWYLKGVDILIRAFRTIAAEFPDVKLKIQGHFPDREPLETMIGDCSQIELLKARAYVETLEVIAGALVMVLPSRTEGMGRVLIEAMAAGRPCVGTAVGGIPHYVRDGRTGFLVRPEDPADLAEKLRCLLSDDALREQMAANAFEYAHREFSEEAFAEKFRSMLEITIGK
jgi:glycosyltransferase involved in cell wall biosynthesis